MIITTNAQKIQDSGKVATTPLTEDDLIFVWQEGVQKVLPANLVGGTKERKTISIVTPTLSFGEYHLGSVEAFPSGVILYITCSAPLTVRLYPSAEKRDADYLRPAFSAEPQGCGIQYEYVAVLSPVVLLESFAQPEKVIQTSDGNLYYSVRNDGTSAVLTITLITLPLE